VTRESASGSGRTETTSATRSLDGQEQALTLTRRWNAEGKEMAPILARNTKEMGDMEHGLGSLGEEFIGSLRGMTIWTAATSLLYGTIGVFGEGVATVVKMERATEGLSQTWGKGGAQAAQLRNDVLALAAAEGRGADEAMAAAARWSHMHLSKDDTAEAVHQSLIAANLAAAGGEEGADAEEKAKQLAAATEAYGLQVSSLASLLDDLNSVTHGLNVTQKDLLDGLDKTAAMAKHAGLPIRELISMIGVGVSASGQSGGQVGTTLRQIMGAVYNPNTQAKLESNFGIDVKTSTGDLKQMDAILESIVARYQQLNRERQDALLTELVGRRQAGAAGAIFDNFPKVEEVARKAAGDEGSAEKDSQGMAGTTQGELQSMKTDAVKTVTEFWDGASRFLDWLAEKAWGNPDEIKKDFDDAKKEAARKAAEAGSNGAPVPVVGAADGVDKSRKDIPKEVTAAKEEAADQRAKRYARLAGYERQVIGVTNEGLPNARGTQSEDVARKLAALNQEEAGLKREDPRFVAQDKAIKEQAQRSLNAANDAQDVPAQYTGAVRYYRDQSAQEAKRLQEMQGARAAMDQMPDAVARKEYLTGPDGSKEKGRLHEITLEREKLENDGRIARIKDDMAEGGRISNRRFSAFDVGSNETERLASEARGGASLVNDAVGRNKAALGRGESGAREAAEAQQLGVNLNQVQLQLEERRYKLARDIVNERLKENEAASKNLVMSGREDQLKAALLAREGQKRGGKGFTNEEFMFFTPETKRAVQDFTPGLLPPAARGERQKLEGEASQLQQIIGPLRKVLDESIARAGGAKVNAPAGTGAPAAPPQINVAPMTFTFSEQFAQISDVLVKAVDARLGPEIAAIGAKVDAIIASRTQGRAQSAGADVIHGGD
jgi:TP901 family phage tail tape measure protein